MADSDREMVWSDYKVFNFDMNTVTSTEVTHILGINPSEAILTISQNVQVQFSCNLVVRMKVLRSVIERSSCSLITTSYYCCFGNKMF